MHGNKNGFGHYTGKNSHEEILRKFRDDNINVMVGTQMIAKGHDFPTLHWWEYLRRTAF